MARWCRSDWQNVIVINPSRERHSIYSNPRCWNSLYIYLWQHGWRLFSKSFCVAGNCSVSMERVACILSNVQVDPQTQRLYSGLIYIPNCFGYVRITKLRILRREKQKSPSGIVYVYLYSLYMKLSKFLWLGLSKANTPMGLFIVVKAWLNTEYFISLTFVHKQMEFHF